jgi:hypothetical protein
MCLGPWVRPAAARPYQQAVQRAVDLLEGRDRGLLDELVTQRDALAESLRFEQAAALRDQIRELERLLGDRQRLEAVAQRNLVVVAPSRQAGCRELFFIQAGRLVDQRRQELPARADRLRRALRSIFGTAPPTGPIEREIVDEMRQLDGWLRRERTLLHCVAVDPAEPESAISELLQALKAEPGSRRTSPRAKLAEPAVTAV